MNRQLIRLVLDTVGEKITQEEFNLVKDALENYEVNVEAAERLGFLYDNGLENWDKYQGVIEDYQNYLNEL